ncbi:hypothetical protein CVT26_007828 [Gymnopilus dilepis]|uniref:Uncharacterized protein n=1 Tax=Gymnopilus dilepis TaxID=231916 RepID=A0A409WET8_9AGAR|nr:hypothetical protein CVT26_007828 [Gymnopilus dilepis]
MHPFDSDFENNLVREQSLADNITTFRPYPFPGRLLEVPYPLTEQGIPVAPDQMREYCQFRQFDLPTCFHGKETALLVKEAFEDGDCYVTLECDVQGRKEERCPFLINLTALLRNDDSYMDYCLYHRRSYSPSPKTHQEIAVFSDEDTSSDTSSSNSGRDAVVKPDNTSFEPSLRRSVQFVGVESDEPDVDDVSITF